MVEWTVANRGNTHVMNIETGLSLFPEAVGTHSQRQISRITPEGEKWGHQVTFDSETWGTVNVLVCETSSNYICWSLLADDWKMEVSKSGGRIWRVGCDQAQQWRSEDHRIWSFHWPAYDGERIEATRTWRRYRMPEELALRVVRRRLFSMPRSVEHMTIALEPSDEATAASELEVRWNSDLSKNIVIDRRTGDHWPEVHPDVATDLMLGARGARAWSWENRYLAERLGDWPNDPGAL
jgi:hypothetical protein